MTSTTTDLLYPNAEFYCKRCHHCWFCKYSELPAIINNHAIQCKQCHNKLKVVDSDLTKLRDEQKYNQQLSVIIVIFALPYLGICIALGLLLNPLITPIMLAIGFIILHVLCRLLKQTCCRIYLIPRLKHTTTNHPSKKTSRKKK